MREASQKLLTKAEASIKATELLLEAKQAEFAASRIYYAMFYIAEALLGSNFQKQGSLTPNFIKPWLKRLRID